MLTTYHATVNGPRAAHDVVIEWNGSATFNVQIDGVDDVDCFTVYGKAEPAGPCTPSEAHAAAQAHFAEMETETA